MNIKKIKPVLRLAGSKYKKVNFMCNLFNASKKVAFFEVFGGTGIISVNIKHNFPNKVVFLNDYDNLFPLSKSTVKKNLCSYEGNEKYQTELAIKYFNTRVKNGLWDKVKIYNEILDGIVLSHENYLDLKIPKNSFVYFDPPYWGRDNLYKNNINHIELFDFVQKLDDSITWVISYSNDPYILNMYKNYFIMHDIYEYTGLATKTKLVKNEIWISNKNIFKTRNNVLNVLSNATKKSLN